MKEAFSRIHRRLGDFWWYSLLLFLALRVGDVINAFVGLWLVPRYVPQAELGAVTPLLQITGVLGLPITILVITFTKFLNRYQALGEAGKVKSLIRSFFICGPVAIVIGSAAALLLMPHFFERIRVASGSLGVIVIAAAVLGTTAPVFTNALQALKKFKALTVMNLLSAPVRLVVMLVAMPFRALSGYMLGQAAPSAFQIVWSCFSIRREVHRSIRAEPFWRSDRREIMRYAVRVTLWVSIGTVIAAVQTMIIRQRLPEIESAAYYMISRFAEVSAYFGLTMAVVMFPMAAEAHTKKGDSLGLLIRTTVSNLVVGGLCVAALAVFGKCVMWRIPLWSAYAPYTWDMVLLAVVTVVSMTISNFNSFEAANNRFGFLSYGMVLSVLHLAVLVCFTGYGFFRGVLPDAAVEWMASLGLCRLRNILLLNLAALSANCFVAIIHVICRERRNRPR